jgi:flagellar hook assembly protein FlgD
MVSIAIYNLAGNEVFRREALPEGQGDHAFAWDGRDRRGRIVPPGAYVLLILAKNEQNRAPGGARKLISVLY